MHLAVTADVWEGYSRFEQPIMYQTQHSRSSTRQKDLHHN